MFYNTLWLNANYTILKAKQGCRGCRTCIPGSSFIEVLQTRLVHNIIVKAHRMSPLCRSCTLSYIRLEWWAITESTRSRHRSWWSISLPVYNSCVVGATVCCSSDCWSTELNDSPLVSSCWYVCIGGAEGSCPLSSPGVSILAAQSLVHQHHQRYISSCNSSESDFTRTVIQMSVRALI